VQSRARGAAGDVGGPGAAPAPGPPRLRARTAVSSRLNHRARWRPARVAAKVYLVVPGVFSTGADGLDLSLDPRKHGALFTRVSRRGLQTPEFLRLRRDTREETH
jgi:hypothetical protein